MVVRTKSLNADWKSSACSNSSANSQRTSPIAVFKIKFVQAIDAEDPNILNSNLLPVKANGEVRFLSVVSFAKEGSPSTPTSM